MSDPSRAPGEDGLESLLRRFWGERDRIAAEPGAAERFGRYRVLRLLGRGGQGAVYLAEDEALRRPVAVKVLSALGVLGQDLVRRFQREAELASRLDHPQLCAVYDSGLVDGVPYLVMRYVEGRTLAALIADARRDGRPLLASDTGATTTTAHRDAVHRVLLLFEQVARGLHVAHEAGIVHRDLKPQNLMVTAAGDPVVLDFGVAADLANDAMTLTRSGELCGTPAYMSPEQLALGPHAVDRRSDVFALGVCLYEALTLRRPFEAPTREALFVAIRSAEATDPRRLATAIPRDLAVVLATALQKERERRYASMADLADELCRVRRLQPIRARRASNWLRMRRWAQRNPLVAASTAALFVVLSVGLAWTSVLLARNDQSLREIAQLADLKRYRDLAAWSEELFPPRWSIVGGPRGIDAWLSEADALVSRAPMLRAAFDSIAAAPPQGVADLRRELDAVREAALGELLTGIEMLDRRIAAMQERRSFALQVDRVTLTDAAPLWQRARDELAEDTRFAGVALLPLRGLIPLGKDPRSGLQEFAVLQTGTTPRRDPSSGELVLDEGFALVLVLLPGGRFLMGASVEPGSPRFDRDAKPVESPVHEVALAPFLLSKFEMTQAQWSRLAGANPSTLAAGWRSPRGYVFTSRHPVESVSQDDAHAILRRAGLRLPTESQWEYACRATTTTVYATGDDPRSLLGHANILDESGARAITVRRDPLAGFDDGQIDHAPVGSYRPNGFGLHDMHGNLWELCEDAWGDYRLPVRAGDGLRLVPPDTAREIVNRSSCFTYDERFARCAMRNACEPSFRYKTLGVRPARPLMDG